MELNPQDQIERNFNLLKAIEAAGHILTGPHVLATHGNHDHDGFEKHRVTHVRSAEATVETLPQQ